MAHFIIYKIRSSIRISAKKKKQTLFLLLIIKLKSYNSTQFLHAAEFTRMTRNEKAMRTSSDVL